MEIFIIDMLIFKMVGFWFSLIVFEKLFKMVYNVFMMEIKLENFVWIFFVFYQFEKVYCLCIGILKDEKIFKVLKLLDIIEVIELEVE